MKYKREKSKCTTCPLRDRTRVWGEGWENAKLAVVGECPGREENNVGRPFVGASGRFFTWALGQAGAMRSKLWITNVLSCRPPGNDFSSPEAGAARAACSFGFWEEIAELKRRGIGTLLLLGGSAMRMFSLEGQLSRVRGSVYQSHQLYLIPTWHPAYLVRMGYTKRGAPVDMTSTWIADLAKAVDVSKNGWSPPAERFTLSPDWADLERFSRGAEGKKLAVDIEVTGGMNPEFNQIVMIGFAYSGEDALVVPLVDRRENPYWANGKFQQMRQWVNQMLTNHSLVLQNALYDILILREFGYNVSMSDVGEDIMLAHHSFHPEAPHDLGFINSLYGKTPYHKATLKNAEGILSLPDEEARTYNARDCVVLHQILPALLKDLAEAGTEKIYREQSLPLLGPLLEAKETGILLDKNKLLSYKRKLKRRLAALARKLRQIAHLPDSFNLDSDDELRWLLYGQRPAKFDKLSGMEDFQPRRQLQLRCRDCGSVRWYWEAGAQPCGKCGGKNLQLKDERVKSKRSRESKLYQELLGLEQIAAISPWVPPTGFGSRATETGKATVNEQARTSLIRAIVNRLDRIGKLKNPPEGEKQDLQSEREFLDLYNQFAAVGKLLSTYTSYPTWEDGRVHCSMLIHGTSSGRLAHRNPNLANVPKSAGIEAREPFIAGPGYVFLSRDYTNLEVFILAYLTGDEPLIEFLESGGNLHDKNTRDLFGYSPADPQWDAARACAKVFQFGGIQYAGGDREIHERMMLKAPELNLTFAEYKKAKEAYMAAHPAYARWKENTIARAHRDRATTTAFGRVRLLTGKEKDIEKESLNSPIQGTAADVINLALIRSWEQKNTKFPRARFLLQIHDELLWEVPEGDLENFDALLKQEMERPVEINGKSRKLWTTRAVGHSLGKLKGEET